MQKIKPNLGCLDLLVFGNPSKAFQRDSCQIKVQINFKGECKGLLNCRLYWAKEINECYT